MKKSLSYAAVAIMSFMAFLAPQAQAQSSIHKPTVVSQGDKVTINNKVSCTVGYVDKLSHKAYLADHCLPPHQKSIITNKNGEKIGEAFGHSGDQPMGIAKSRNDVSYISLYSDVVVGENSYSGDKRASASKIKPGERMCMYSRGYNSVHCGRVKAVDGTLVVGDEHVNGIPGDSGGPAWVIGKGFVGVYTLIIDGGHQFTSIDDRNCAEGDPNVVKDGTVDYSKMCRVFKYSPRSPHVVGRDYIRNPDKNYGLSSFGYSKHPVLSSSL